MQVRDSRVRRSEITFDDGQAALDLGVAATVSLRNEPAQMHVGRWDIHWRRESDQWRVTAVRPREIDTLPIDSLERLGARLP